MPYSVVYHSKAKEDFTLSKIDMMLIKAKRFNKNNNITGCIIYHDHEFIQIIEGEKQIISELYHSIKNDDRHYDVTTLIETPSEQTLWDDWSMAFYKFTGDQKQREHNRMLLETYFNSVNDEQKSSEVFLTFKENVLKLLDI
ncbi:BLUF domain-containing protein [Psychroserpens sp. BH13MA-6]